MLLGKLGDDGLFHDARVAAAAQRVPRLQRDAVLGEGPAQLGLREVGVALDLDDGGHDLALLHDLLDLVGVEVGDADGAELAGLVGGLELLIAVDVVGGGLVQDDEFALIELTRTSLLPCFTTDAARSLRYWGIGDERVCVPIADEDVNVSFWLAGRDEAKAGCLFR